MIEWKHYVDISLEVTNNEKEKNYPLWWWLKILKPKALHFCQRTLITSRNKLEETNLDIYNFETSEEQRQRQPERQITYRKMTVEPMNNFSASTVTVKTQWNNNIVLIIFAMSWEKMTAK